MQSHVAFFRRRMSVRALTYYYDSNYSGAGTRKKQQKQLIGCHEVGRAKLFARIFMFNYLKMAACMQHKHLCAYKSIEQIFMCIR